MKYSKEFKRIANEIEALRLEIFRLDVVPEDDGRSINDGLFKIQSDLRDFSYDIENYEEDN